MRKAPKAKGRHRIGWRSLRYVCPNLSKMQAQNLSWFLGDAMAKQGITTKARAAMFIAQCAHESGGFHYVEEIASGDAYEWRKDLGNTRKGDGRKYKGRGYIQITGRANYYRMSKILGENFIKYPQSLTSMKFASLSAAVWWRSAGCNTLCTAIKDPHRRLLQVTKRINGGLNGLQDRKNYFSRARRVQRFLVPKG